MMFPDRLLVFADGVFHNNQLGAQLGLFAVLGIRTIADYWACWTFYFPIDSTLKAATTSRH
jgi:hypothetical protein